MYIYNVYIYIIYICVCVCVCVYVYAYVYVCLCLCICMMMHVYSCMHAAWAHMHIIMEFRFNPLQALQSDDAPAAPTRDVPESPRVTWKMTLDCRGTVILQNVWALARRDMMSWRTQNDLGMARQCPNVGWSLFFGDGWWWVDVGAEKRMQKPGRMTVESELQQQYPPSFAI